MNQLQRDNLRTLANFLRQLPAKTPHFNMSVYQKEDRTEYQPNVKVVDPNECGSSACAIGWGPTAGIPLEGDRSWPDYAQRVFGGDEADYPEAFGVTDDNNPHHAADRIEALLSYADDFDHYEEDFDD